VSRVLSSEVPHIDPLTSRRYELMIDRIYCSSVLPWLLSYKRASSTSKTR